MSNIKEGLKDRIRKSSISVYRPDFEEWSDVLTGQIISYLKRQIEEQSSILPTMRVDEWAKGYCKGYADSREEILTNFSEELEYVRTLSVNPNRPQL